MTCENLPDNSPRARPSLQYISICSGIEAATVAFHPLGWTPLAFAEIEAFPSAVLAHHYPTIPNLGDITKYLEWPEELLAECDLLVGGPPCQAFSIAGQRESLADERGNLTLTYVKIVNHIDSIRRKYGRNPIVTLYENVPGLYSTRDNAFGCLVGALCGQDAAIETETGKWPATGVFWGTKRRVGYRTLDAQYFGLAQRRRRCFLIAVPNELVERIGNRADPAEILSIPESLRRDTTPRRETREDAARGSASGALRGCWWDGGQVSQTLDAVLSKGQTMPEKNRFPAVLQPVTHSLRAEGFDASDDGTGRGTPLVPITAGTLKANNGGGGWSNSVDHAAAGYMVPVPILEAGARTGISTDDPRADIGIGEPGDPMFTLQAGKQHAVAYRTNAAGQVDEQGECAASLTTMTDPTTQFIAFSCKDHGADAGDTSPTLRAMGHNGSHANAGGQVAVAISHQPYAVRRITPEEAEALQGFSDGYTAIPWRGKPASECPDGPRYKALGNSMAVPCMSWIGRRIQEVENLITTKP